MKNSLLLTALLIISTIAISQSVSIINYSQWSDPQTFQLSPSPKITGYGYFSDSLSKVYDNKAFYEYDNKYYCIESWADYYFWFTEKYSHLFEDPGAYGYYYWTNNDLGMASYIASNKYLGEFYPSLFQIDFEGNVIEKNRLANDQYLPKKEKSVEKLEKQAQDVNNKTTSKEGSLKSPSIFKKEEFRKNEYKSPSSTKGNMQSTGSGSKKTIKR